MVYTQPNNAVTLHGNGGAVGLKCRATGCRLLVSFQRPGRGVHAVRRPLTRRSFPHLPRLASEGAVWGAPLVAPSAAVPSRGHPSSSPPPPQQVNVTFQIPYRTMVGESFSVVGSLPQLGGWSMEGAVPLHWCGGHVWRGTATLPAESEIEFKFVLHGAQGGETWQGGSNRRLTVPEDQSAVEVRCSWDIEAVTVHPVFPANKADINRNMSEYGEELSHTERELIQAKQSLAAFEQQGPNKGAAQPAENFWMQAVDVTESADKIQGLQELVENLRDTHTQLQKDWDATGGVLTTELFQEVKAEAEQAGSERSEEATSGSPGNGGASPASKGVAAGGSPAPGTLAFAVGRMATQSKELVSVAAELSAAKLELSQARQQIGNLRAQLDAAMAATTERVMTAGSSTRAKGASQPTQAGRDDNEKKSEQTDDGGDDDGETPRRQRQTTGSQRTVGDKEKNLAAQLEQQREAVAARTAEAEELRRQLSAAQTAAWHSESSQFAAARDVEAATQRERQLSDRLRAAQAEIVSLRQWVDQAVAAQTEWKAQAERWQRSQSEMEGLRAALQRSAEEKRSAAEEARKREAAAITEAQQRTAMLGSQLEEQRAVVAAREAEAAELRLQLAAVRERRAAGDEGRGGGVGGEREARLREALSAAEAELSGLRAQVQAALTARQESEAQWAQWAAQQDDARRAEVTARLQEQGARMAAELQQWREYATAKDAEAQGLRQELANARRNAQPQPTERSGAQGGRGATVTRGGQGATQQAANHNNSQQVGAAMATQNTDNRQQQQQRWGSEIVSNSEVEERIRAQHDEIERLRQELQSAMSGRADTAVAAKEAILKEAGRSQQLAAALQDRDQRLAALTEQQRALAQTRDAEAEELRRQLAATKTALRAAAREVEESLQREAAMREELRSAGVQLRAAAAATADAQRMEAYMEEMATELQAESQRAARLQERFARLQSAAAGSANALRTFEERLSAQYDEMDLLRSGLAGVTKKLLADQASNAAALKEMVANVLQRNRAEWTAKLRAAEGATDELRQRLEATERELQAERRRRR